ncbi:MAG: hypothetical protein PHU23_08505, partial [Dehalococcoidales bacterium]|nr:hypothetical protein [Dehalococcoidales bacterium]
MTVRRQKLSQGIGLSRDLGYLRIGAAVPELRVADVDFNVESIIGLVRKAREEKVQALCFPEMALTGYTVQDLVQHAALLRKVESGLTAILSETAGQAMIVIAGAPLAVDQKIFNCAVVISDGRILGIIPKAFLPNYKEFYDERFFESGRKAQPGLIEIAGQQVPFGTDIIFKLKGVPDAVLGVEICEDLWVPFAPHEFQSVAGANVIFNLSASNEVLGKDDWRRIIVSSESGRCLAAYCYLSSSIGESSNDMIFGGHGIIAENGTVLEESPRLCTGSQLIISDIDIERLVFDRRLATSFHDAWPNSRPFRVVEADVSDFAVTRLWRTFDPYPFVPGDKARRAERCREIFSMQVGALSKKLTGAKKKKLVLGVSGGLDSTLALLAAVKTMDFLGLPRTNVYSYTLPGFGTTRRT